MTVTENESVLTRAIRGVSAKFGRYKLQLSMLGIFLGIWTIFFVMKPSAFSSPIMFVALLSMSSIMAILAISETVVVVCGELDLSFPSVMGLSACVFTLIYLPTGNPVIALLGALCAAIAAGVLNGVLVTKVGLPSLITTVGTLFLWRGIVTGLTKGQMVIPGLKEEALRSILVGKAWGCIPVQFFWAIGIMILLWVILNRHKIGAHIYHAGDNRESAKMMGVNVTRTKFIAFVQLGFFAGFAGLITLLEMGIFFPALGTSFFLPALAALFVGGTSPLGGEGTVFGSFMGGLILGLIGIAVNVIGVGLWREMFFGAVLVIALVVHAFLRRGVR